MKVIFKISFLLFFISVKVNGQVYFNNNYEYNANNSNATAVLEVDSGYLFPACIYGSGYGSFLIIKVDYNGDTLWSKEYRDSLHSFSTGSSNSIIKTIDNNFVFSGAIIISSGNPDAFLVKITENGDTLWTKKYGGTNFDNANVVCETPDSGFVLMGVTQSFSTGSASDFYLVKTDKNGNEQWHQAYGTTAVEDCVSGQITLDGGYIMSGRKSNMFHIIKTAANGTFQWQQTYSGTKGVCFIKQLADSTYILTGAKAVSGLGDQACIIKVSKTGSVIWQKTYGDVVNNWLYSQPVILNDGSIVTAGASMLGSIPIGLLLKTDSLGNEQWIRTYYKNTSGDNYFYDVKSTSDNGFVMSGFALVATSDPWLVKVDEFGCEVSNCSVGITETEINSEKLKAYPNPATAHVTVEIKGDESLSSQLIIYNLFGKEIRRSDVRNNSTLTIDTQGFANGIYLFVLKSKDVIPQMKRVVISR